MTVANVANILTLVVSLSVHLQSHVVDLDLEARAKQQQECWLHPHQYVPFFRENIHRISLKIGIEYRLSWFLD